MAMLLCRIEPRVVMADRTGARRAFPRAAGGSMRRCRHDLRRLRHCRRRFKLARASLVHKYCGDGGVAIAYFGDGAANQGQVYEAQHGSAAVHTVFVIENKCQVIR
jgi:pyruvate dehydrogenase E1 component alpha subunit